MNIASMTRQAPIKPYTRATYVTNRKIAPHTIEHFPIFAVLVGL